MASVTSEFPAVVWNGLAQHNQQRPTRFVDQAPNFEDWDQMVAEMLATQTYLVSITGGGEHLDLSQQAAVAGPTGGTTIDVEARAVIEELITFLKNTGLMAAT